MYKSSKKKLENMRELEYRASSPWGMFATVQVGARGIVHT